MNLLLNGHVDDGEAVKLRDLIVALEGRVASLESQQASVQKEAIIGLLNLLGNAMRQIASGQIDLSSQPPGAVGVTDRIDKWEAVQKRFGGKEAELIEVLLTCGPRTNTQLKSLLKLAYSTVAALTLKMSNLGFLTRVGEGWGLKD